MKRLILIYIILIFGVSEANADKFRITALNPPEITINGNTYHKGDTIESKDTLGEIKWINDTQSMEAVSLSDRKNYRFSKKIFESKGASSILGFLNTIKVTTPASSAILIDASAEECYRRGQQSFETKNYEKAMKWYLKAADKGSAAAQYMLGTIYDKGLGVSQDNAKAVEWYRKAAEQGVEDAKNALERIDAQ